MWCWRCRPWRLGLVEHELGPRCRSAALTPALSRKRERGPENRLSGKSGRALNFSLSRLRERAGVRVFARRKTLLRPTNT